MADILFAHSDALEPDNIDRYAVELDLDIDKFDDDLRTGDYVNRVEDEELDANSSDVEGTPTFYLGRGDTNLVRHTGPYDADSGVGAGLNYSIRLPWASQCSATFFDGCTRGGSPGILG